MFITALQTPPREIVKKNVGAIHIKNNGSCLQRKLYDVLLYNAFEELKELSIHAHSILVKDLTRLVGFNSRNRDYLRQSLKGMITTPIEWNIIDEEGHAEWGCSGALADADIINGVCTYSYSRKLRLKLAMPKVYSAIDLAINRKFNSGLSMALYQNIVRFRDVAQTPFFPLDLLKDLIGVTGNTSYDDYKILNRAVIKPAIREINKVSDIIITPEPQRTLKRVVAIKFRIESKDLSTVDGVQPNPEDGSTASLKGASGSEKVGDVDGLADQLMAYYRLTSRQAAAVLSDFPIERVLLAMKYVEQQYKRGRVKSIAPYFLKVVKEADLVDGQSAFDLEAAAANEEKEAAVAKVARQQDLRDKFTDARRTSIKNYVADLYEVERQNLIDTFGKDLSSKNKLVYNKYLNCDKSLTNKMVAAEFFRYVEDLMVSKKLLLVSEAAYVQFVAAQGG